MYLIIGLGNPEKEYHNTRHNMGFNVINKISEEYKIDVQKTKFKSLYGTGEMEGEKVVLLKPQTFMNNSGEAVIEAFHFFKIPLENIIVVYDDIDIQPGKIRIRKNGTAGTHNGMKSVVENLGTTDFTRVRIGIGKPNFSGDMINYVIGNIPQEEVEILEEGVKKGFEAIVEIIKNGENSAMNKFN